jgi:hypothetical protein
MAIGIVDGIVIFSPRYRRPIIDTSVSSIHGRSPLNIYLT